MNKSYPGKIRIIAGSLRGRMVSVLDRDSLRPTPDRVRETLFNWLQPRIVGARCLDCFAGTGILGFEAISRGAKEVTMLDSSSVITSALKQTMIDFKIEPSQSQIINQDILQWLSKQTDIPHDIIFLDAPFESDLLQTCLHVLESKTTHPDAWLYIEASSTTPLPASNIWTPFKSKVAGKVAYYLLSKS